MRDPRLLLARRWTGSRRLRERGPGLLGADPPGLRAPDGDPRARRLRHGGGQEHGRDEPADRRARPPSGRRLLGERADSRRMAPTAGDDGALRIARIGRDPRRVQGPARALDGFLGASPGAPGTGGSPREALVGARSRRPPLPRPRRAREPALRNDHRRARGPLRLEGRPVGARLPGSPEDERSPRDGEQRRQRRRRRVGGGRVEPRRQRRRREPDPPGASGGDDRPRPGRRRHRRLPRPERGPDRSRWPSSGRREAARRPSALARDGAEARGGGLRTAPALRRRRAAARAAADLVAPSDDAGLRSRRCEDGGDPASPRGKVGAVTAQGAAHAAAVGALVVAGGLPLLAMLVASVWTPEGFELDAYASLFGATRPWVLMLRSLAVGSIATGAALAIGWPAGVLCERTDLPGSGLLTLVAAVPFVLPTYVQAVAWAGLLGRGGFWLDSLLGVGVVLGVCFAPLVLLATRASLRAVDPRLEEAARLSAGWLATLRRVTLPLALPGTLRAAGLVFLLAVGDLAVPTYLGVSVFPTESFTHFAAAYRFSTATAFAVPLAGLAVLVLALESWLVPERVAGLRRVAEDGARARIALGRARWPLATLVLAAAGALVVLPLGALVRDALAPGALAEAWQRAGDAALRSLGSAALGACLLTLAGFVLGHGIERRLLPGFREVDRLSLLLFATPGTVIGIGLVALWNHPATGWIYGTWVVVLLGNLGQLSAVPSRLCRNAVAAVPTRLEEAAQLAGARWLRRMLGVVVPLAAPGLVAAWLASFLFCLRDLGISLIVYPPGADTLPVRTFTLAANGRPELVAALCVMMIVAALGPLLVLGASLRRVVVR